MTDIQVPHLSPSADQTPYYISFTPCNQQNIEQEEYYVPHLYDDSRGIDSQLTGDPEIDDILQTYMYDYSSSIYDNCSLETNETSLQVQTPILEKPIEE